MECYIIVMMAMKAQSFELLFQYPYSPSWSRNSLSNSFIHQDEKATPTKKHYADTLIVHFPYLAFHQEPCYMLGIVFPKTLYLFFPTLWILMTITCYYLAFSLLFSTHKYILTGVISSLGLNRIAYLFHQVWFYLLNLMKITQKLNIQWREKDVPASN